MNHVTLFRSNIVSLHDKLPGQANSYILLDVMKPLTTKRWTGLTVLNRTTCLILYDLIIAFLKLQNLFIERVGGSDIKLPSIQTL